MDFVQAVRALHGNTDLMAVLPGARGDVPHLFIGQGTRILDVRNGRPRSYVPKLADIVSIEWSVIQISVMAKQNEAARAAAAKAERGE